MSLEDTGAEFVGEGVLHEGVAEKATRRRWTFDEEAGAAVVFDPADGSSKSFSLTDLPNISARRLCYIALCSVVGRADDMGAAYANLLAGKPPARKAKVGVKLDNWRAAIALAMVDATKKSAEPLTLEAARAKAAELTRAEVAPRKLDAAVVKHFVKLTGAVVGSVAALLAPPAEA